MAFSVPKKPIQWEVYRPIKGAPRAFIGIVEAPDETSALKAAIEEFGIINPQQTVCLCGACPATMIRLLTPPGSPWSRSPLFLTHRLTSLGS